MAYRNGVYFGFDGLGKTDPTQSDFKYYSIMMGWNECKNIEFSFVNSHEKTCAVKDCSTIETLKNRILERMRNSKSIFIVLTSSTRKTGSMLSYEIEKAADNYNLPFIIAYPGYRAISTPQDLASFWPDALQSRIANNKIRSIHIPFKANIIATAMNYFSVVTDKYPGYPLSIYGKETHISCGCLTQNEKFANLKS